MAATVIMGVATLVADASADTVAAEDAVAVFTSVMPAAAVIREAVAILAVAATGENRQGLKPSADAREIARSSVCGPEDVNSNNRPNSTQHGSMKCGS